MVFEFLADLFVKLVLYYPNLLYYFVQAPMLILYFFLIKPIAYSGFKKKPPWEERQKNVKMIQKA